METPRNPVVVAKPNPLVVASGVLTTNEKKLFNTALNIISRKKKEDDKLRWTTTYKELKELTGLPTPQRINEAFKGLQNADIKIYDFMVKGKHVKPKKYTKFSCKYIGAFAYNEETGDCYFEIVQTLYDMLQHDHYFAQIDTKIAKQIKSKHSLWLYEIISDYRGIGSRTLTIEEIRILADLRDNQYPLTSDLTKHIIKKAVEELGNKTSWTIGFKTNKQGRKVLSYTFHFRDNNPKEIERQIEYRDFVKSLVDKPVEIEKYQITIQFRKSPKGKILIYDVATDVPADKAMAIKIFEWFYVNIEKITYHDKRGNEAFEFWRKNKKGLFDV